MQDDKAIPVRLLQALAAQGAYAFAEMVKGRETVIVVAAKNGVSVRVGKGSAKDAARLCSRGLASWRPGASRQRLHLTDAGQSWLARLHSPDGINGFFAQHQPLTRRKADASSDAAMVFEDTAESPLAWLATRKGRNGKSLIDVACLAAGERLRRDFTSAAMLPRITANWSSLGANGGRGAQPAEYSDAVFSARQRVTNALAAVGQDFAGLLTDVCGFLKGLETVESERGWPARSAKLALALALRQLCRHYGIALAAQGPDRSQGVRHWGTADFRPFLDGGASPSPAVTKAG